MFRMMFLTFWGNFRGTEKQAHHLHESPISMTFPLIVLAVLSVIGGFMGVPEVLGGQHWLAHYLAPVFEMSAAKMQEGALDHNTEYMLMGVSVLGVIIAIVYAAFRYVKKSHIPALDGENQSALAKLSYNKFYFDELYETIIQKPLDAISGFFFKVVDKAGIDGLVNGLGSGSQDAGKTFRLLQTGNVGFYIFAMVVGIIGVLVYSLFKF